MIENYPTNLSKLVRSFSSANMPKLGSNLSTHFDSFILKWRQTHLHFSMSLENNVDGFNLIISFDYIFTHISVGIAQVCGAIWSSPSLGSYQGALRLLLCHLSITRWQRCQMFPCWWSKWTTKHWWRRDSLQRLWRSSCSGVGFQRLRTHGCYCHLV